MITRFSFFLVALTPLSCALSIPRLTSKIELDTQHDNLRWDLQQSTGKQPHPLVLWHGLGDSAHSAGMTEFAELIKQVHPGIFVHSIALSDDSSADQKAGWFGDVNAQVDIVATELSTIPELKNGFDAIGFSQGGQFLRAYVERYNNPPIRSLLTFGSQHVGISDLPGCKTGDFLCWLARNTALRGMYSNYAQSHLVQAQYFRDPRSARDLQSYYAANTFLADINAEIPDTDEKLYKKNLASLDALVLVLFSEDKTVVPKESGWFGSYKPASLSEPDAMDEEVIVPMRQQPIYKDDRIGLRTLDEAGKIHFTTCEGPHMRISDDCWKPLVLKFCGDRRGDKDEQDSSDILIQ
ncbi:palmitoyl-protein thioesterase [Rhizoctonia solani AG-1 IB]|uniref:Palmitoyl-protein thioesterase 1 n=1 Tax=Thanatephorus cucumeris (strain AG1-IB / isolate 7/3/14) TaxID=1108050 RepID=A0A0B7FUE8_THACB|nr:palmitoyl-protein thioesterase [Rhizoctonia solani AG-1 IB]